MPVGHICYVPNCNIANDISGDASYQVITIRDPTIWASQALGVLAPEVQRLLGLHECRRR